MSSCPVVRLEGCDDKEEKRALISGWGQLGTISLWIFGSYSITMSY